jgi:hypothetical protein
MTADRACSVAREVLGEPMASAQRFTTGAGNWVYDVTAASGRRVVVRFMRSREEFESGILWNGRLRPLGVPLPKMLAYQRSFEGDSPGGWFVLERLRGVDLEHAYATLTTHQKMSVLDGVMRAQEIVRRSIPRGTRFGYCATPDVAPHPTWSASISADLERSRRWIMEVGVVDPNHVSRVERLQPAFEKYFAGVQPIPFMDDTTTRNVIVHEGALAGIVDVDSICCGDPLIVPALTRMALLNMGCDTIYPECWLDRMDATSEQRRVFDFYTARCAVDFLSEQGQKYNRDSAPPVDPAEVNKLERILDALLQRIA